MRSQFSTAWMGSKQVRKQRKFRANAPLHLKHIFLSAHLSKTLKQEHKSRSLPLRKGDEVLIMRGSFKKRKAKVISIDLKNTRVALEGIQRSKKDGTKVNVYFHPSNLTIQSLNTDDKRRLQKDVKPAEKKVEKTEKKTKENKNASNKS